MPSSVKSVHSVVVYIFLGYIPAQKSYAICILFALFNLLLLTRCLDNTKGESDGKD